MRPSFSSESNHYNKKQFLSFDSEIAYIRNNSKHYTHWLGSKAYLLTAINKNTVDTTFLLKSKLTQTTCCTHIAKSGGGCGC